MSIIIPLLANGAFDPEATTVLASAFDVAWDRIKASGAPLADDTQSELARERLAKCIIEIGRHGERNLERLVERALGRLVDFQNLEAQAAGTPSTLRAS